MSNSVALEKPRDCFHHFLKTAPGRVIPGLFLFFLLNYQPVLASVTNSLSRIDSLLPQIKEHKMSRMDFLDKYGREDSARALINSYFAKRAGARRTTFLSLAALLVVNLVAALALQHYGNSNSAVANDPDPFDAFLVAVGFLTIVEGSIALMITGGIRWIIYSRKKLLSLLKGYYAGKPIPRRIAKSRSFKKWLDEADRPGAH